jgi:SNF2 family DNA or RNA helicase
MKTLYPAQQTALEFFVQAQNKGQGTLDSSVVGTGKTVVSAHLIQSLGQPFAVVCPKAVITSWKRELALHGVEPLFVLNYEQIRNGKTEFLKKAGKKIMRWCLPPNTLLIFDEVQKCKSPFTQNAQLLISAKQQGIRVHLLSATACEDPTEMRSIGFALGLHNLNNSNGKLKSWQSWMYTVGCKPDIWGAWCLINQKKLKDVKDQIYKINKNGFRLTIADFPDSFKDNRVQILPVNCLKSVGAAYTKNKLSEKALLSYIEDAVILEDGAEEEIFIVRLLRARQEAELGKVPELVALAEDYVEQGLAVVLFVNFRQTAADLVEHLNCRVIQGGQTAEVRQQAIDRFQKDQDQVLVVNIEAGGTGLSLHDVNGVRPRVSLISPTFNAKSHLQVLGRIHRNGAKSDALQQIVVAADTVEEAVVQAVVRKCKNIKELHGE